MAPCVDKISAEQYDENIKAIRAIIKGNFKDSLQQFKRQMQQHAENMAFEEAQNQGKLDVLARTTKPNLPL